MSKKIRQKKIQTREEKEEERLREVAEKAKEQAGIDDEFQAKGFELAEWAQTNSHIVLGMIGVIMLAGLATFAMSYMDERSGHAASIKFDAAHDAFNASLGDAPDFGAEEETGLSFKDAKERAEKSRALFKEVVKEHSSSGAGELSALYIGHTSVTLEDWDGASAAYQTFLDATSKLDPFRFLALDGLAIALENKGDAPGAIRKLEELIGLPGTVNEDVALLRVARLYEKAGEKGKARSAAERIVKDFADSPTKADAEKILATLGPA